MALPIKIAGSTPTADIFLDPEIEAVLLASILRGLEGILGSGLLDQIKEHQFGTPVYRWLISETFGKVTFPIAKPILSSMIDDKIVAHDEREKTKEALLRLYELDVSWAPDAMLVFRKYLAFQTTSASIKEFFENFNRTRNVELGLRTLSEGFTEANRILNPVPVQIVDYAKTYETREKARIHKRDNPALYPRLRMGVSKFDEQIKMEAGTVTNFLAPMKRYKSVILASLAFAGVLQGFNVAFTVLENTIDLTMNRLDSMFSAINYNRIVNALKSKAEKQAMDELFSRMDSWEQRLKVIKGEPSLIGTVEIEALLSEEKRKSGFVADVKIYDYLNIMKPSTGGKADDHLGQTQLVWDLQSVAKKANELAVVITATQANMAGAEIDKDGKPVKLRQHHQGRAIGIAQAVDATIGIDVELGKSDDSGYAAPPTLVLSPLYLRDGVILYPDVRLVSEIDRMCVDREMRRLWEETHEWEVTESSSL